MSSLFSKEKPEPHSTKEHALRPAGFFDRILLTNGVIGLAPQPNALTADYFASRLKEAATLLIISPNFQDLSAIQRRLKKSPRIHYIHDDYQNIRLDLESLDALVIDRVLEFQENPESSFENFIRYLKPRGEICVRERDLSQSIHYPIAEYLELQNKEIEQQMIKAGQWDPYIGRKLNTFFVENEFEKIELNIDSHSEVSLGSNEKHSEVAWQDWYRRVEWAEKNEKIKLSFDLKAFRSEMLSFFENPCRFSYSPFIKIFAIKTACQ